MDRIDSVLVCIHTILCRTVCQNFSFAIQSLATHQFVYATRHKSLQKTFALVTLDVKHVRNPLSITTFLIPCLPYLYDQFLFFVGNKCQFVSVNNFFFTTILIPFTFYSPLGSAGGTECWVSGRRTFTHLRPLGIEP